jgi:hypothetical protein
MSRQKGHSLVADCADIDNVAGSAVWRRDFYLFNLVSWQLIHATTAENTDVGLACVSHIFSSQ